MCYKREVSGKTSLVLKTEPHIHRACVAGNRSRGSFGSNFFAKSFGVLAQNLCHGLSKKSGFFSNIYVVTTRNKINNLTGKCLENTKKMEFKLHTSLNTLSSVLSQKGPLSHSNILI